MVSFNPQVFPVVVNNHMYVKAAAEISGYSLQFLRRLLRNGKLEGFKVGQVWLIKKNAFAAYLKKAIRTSTRRFGPQ
jgi:excisionase family DNA binding protein